MGTHGLRGVDRLMLGSVTEKVLRKARCPVLVVRKPVHDFVSPGEKADPINIKRIVLCMDFSEHAQRALNHAFSIAKQYNAELTLLHVLEHLPGSADVQSATAKATEQLRESVPPRARKPSLVKFLVRIGKPYQQIIERRPGSADRLGDHGGSWPQFPRQCTLWFHDLPGNPAWPMPCACGPHLKLRELENHSQSGSWINLKLGANRE